VKEALFERITKESLERIRAGKGGGRSILLIFTGGDRLVDEALERVKELSGSGISFAAYLTPSAERIIGRNRVLSSGCGEIIDSARIWDRALLDRFEAVVIPVMTLNALSKISGMIADNPVSNIVLLALRRGMKVVAASDSVICCGGPVPAPTSFFMRQVSGMLSALRNLGVTVTDSKNLGVTVRDALDLPFKTAADNKGYYPSAPCGDNVDECIECGLCVLHRSEAVNSVIAAGASRVSSKQVSGSVGGLSGYIDHTLLKADATQEQIEKLCGEARNYGFATVCVNPANVKLAGQLLSGSGVGVTTVVGFPLGATTPTVKALEARDAIANGADEIDMVINVGALKSGNIQLVEDDIKAVRQATEGKVLKVILETALLNREQIRQGCIIARKAGADFVKTSTGFGPGGATAEDISLMREVVGPAMGVKASGGIRTTSDADDMIRAGASRIGASASVAIVTGKEGGEGY